MSSDIMHRILSFYVISILTFDATCDSFDLIAEYLPKSNVMEHLRLDLDQKDFEDFLKVGNFSSASDIYVNGGNSKKSMKIITYAPLFKAFDKGSKIEQDGAEGILITNAKKGDTSLKVSVTSRCFGKFAQGSLLLGIRAPTPKYLPLGRMDSKKTSTVQCLSKCEKLLRFLLILETSWSLN